MKKLALILSVFSIFSFQEIKAQVTSVVPIPQDTILCEGDVITINFAPVGTCAGPANFEYQILDGATVIQAWSPATTFNASNITGITYTVELRCSSSPGTVVTDTFLVDVITEPIVTGNLAICSGYSTVLTASGSTPPLEWWNSATGGAQVSATATYTTPNLTNTTTYYTQSSGTTGAGGGSGVILITECGLEGFPGATSADYLEISNLYSTAVNTTGWVAAVSNSYTNINLFNATLWNMPSSFNACSVVSRNDVAGTPNYWGNNIFWNPPNNSWAIIIDNLGNVVDFAVWGWTALDIAGFNPTINGFPITLGPEWTGNGIPLPCNTTGGVNFSLQRIGNNDSNTSTDFICQASTVDLVNPGLLCGWSSFSCRFPVTVTVDPGPVVTVPVDSSYCAGDAVPASAFTSVPAGTINWFHTNPAVGLAAGGTSNTPTFTATNMTLFPDTTVVSVYSTLNGCSGDTLEYLIVVNPNPVAQVLPGNNIVCQNIPVDFDVTGNAATGFSYNWSPGQNLSDSIIINPILTTNNLNGITSYTVTVTNDTTGCTFDTIQDITVVPAFTLNSIPMDTNICDGDILNFSTTPNLPGNYTYNWTSNISTLATPADSATTGTFNIPGSDTVIVNVSTGNGPFACVLVDTIYINIATIPSIISTSPDTSICIDGTATLSAIPSGSAFPLSLIWNNGTIAGNGPHNVIPLTNSTYNVYVQDANGCVSPSQNILVTLRDSITINDLYLTDTTICNGEITTLVADATGGGAGLIYTWYDGNNIIIGATDTGAYVITPSYDGEIFTVIVSDSCTTPTDTLTVLTDWADIILPTYTISDSAGCYIDLSFNPVFENTTQNLSPLDSSSWDFGNGTTYSWPFATPFDYHYNEPGTYDITLTITDEHGCIWDTLMDGLHVYAYDQPQADFLWNPNPTDYLNAQITFNNQSTNNFYNQWLFVTDAPYTSTDVNPVFQFPQDRPGSYDVTLITTTEEGCVDSITKVVVIDDVFLFYIPTAFTPNGDGLNDGFKVVGEGLDFNSFKMTVFNKWGELIFETSNPDNGWNGTYKGSIVPSGVYVWKIDAKEAHSPIIHNKDGFVTIVR